MVMVFKISKFSAEFYVRVRIYLDSHLFFTFHVVARSPQTDCYPSMPVIIN